MYSSRVRRRQSLNRVEPTTYYDLDNKSTKNEYEPVMPSIPWIREDFNITEITGEDLSTYLPKTLPGESTPAELTRNTYNYSANSISSPESEPQYRQSRKRRRKYRNSSHSDDSDADCKHGSKKQRIMANDRERKRTQQFNEALSSLKRLVPSLPAEKLSKYHTIKLAAQYIEFLWVHLRKYDSSLEMNQLNFAFTAWRVKSDIPQDNC